MKEFEPSRQFVSKVMKEVRSEAVHTVMPRFLSATFVRPVLSIGGALLGIMNLIRIVFTVFSPALCR